MDLEKENNLTREEFLKVHQRRKTKIIADAILIAVLVLIFIYLFYNIQLIKYFNQDWCSLCEVKTGAKCYAINLP